jgi:hypothetical protein
MNNKKTKEKKTNGHNCTKCAYKERMGELKMKNANLTEENIKLRHANKNLTKSLKKHEKKNSGDCINYINEITKLKESLRSCKKNENNIVIQYTNTIDKLKGKLKETTKKSESEILKCKEWKEGYEQFRNNVESKARSLYDQISDLGYEAMLEYDPADNVFDTVFDVISKLLYGFSESSEKKTDKHNIPKKQIIEDDFEVDSSGVHMIKDRTDAIDKEFKRLYGNILK